jgi:hypothetical protein
MADPVKEKAVLKCSGKNDLPSTGDKPNSDMLNTAKGILGHNRDAVLKFPSTDGMTVMELDIYINNRDYLLTKHKINRTNGKVIDPGTSFLIDGESGNVTAYNLGKNADHTTAIPNNIALDLLKEMQSKGGACPVPPLRRSN